MSRSDYRKFMNHLYNELGISKDDIRAWVQEAIEEVAKEYIDHQFSQRSFNNRILDLMKDHSSWNDNIKRDITSKIASEMSQHIQLSLKAE